MPALTDSLAKRPAKAIVGFAKRLAKRLVRLTSVDLVLGVVGLDVAAVGNGWHRRPVAPIAAAPSSASFTAPSRTDGFDFPLPPVVVEMRDVEVIACSRFVITKDGRFVGDELARFGDDSSIHLKLAGMERGGEVGTYRFRHMNRSSRPLPDAIHGMHEYAANYFHAITEVLPRVLVSRQQPEHRDLPVLVNNGTPATIIELVGIVAEGADLIRVRGNTIRPVRRLVYASDVSFIQDVFDHRPRHPYETVIDAPIVRAAVERVLRHFAAEGIRGRRRLYIKRQASFRRVDNEAEIEAALAARGFETVDPGVLTLEAQIRLFREAEIVVAPTGAAVTNMVWCRPGARMVVLSAEHPAMPNEIWFQLGRVSGQEVTRIAGTPLHRRDDVHDDFTVAVDEVLRAV